MELPAILHKAYKVLSTVGFMTFMTGADEGLVYGYSYPRKDGVMLHLKSLADRKIYTDSWREVVFVGHKKL